MFSPFRPHARKHRSSSIPGGPVFRTGTLTVYNGKPNRGASARATNRFIAEAVVPFPFTGMARESLDRKGAIPTPTLNPETVRKCATWVNKSE